MSVFTEDFRLTSIRPNQEIPTGMDAALYKAVGRYRSRGSIAKGILQEADAVQTRALAWRELSLPALGEALGAMRKKFQREAEPGLEIVADALSLAAEAAFRSLGIRPYTVQLAGALAMYRGYVAEMATGEGKTLTACLCAVLRGWSGRPCHIITANDYLAARDARHLESMYKLCGLTVGSVVGEAKPPDRKHGYAKDITYSTAKEVTADFLRDRLALGALQNFERRQIRALFGENALPRGEVVMRGIHAAIIDEADSLLIDEAVTPLIISRQAANEAFVEACRVATQVAAKLEPGTHYTVDHQFKEVELAPDLDYQADFAGLGIPRQYTAEGFLREMMRQALVAREFFHRDKNYVIQDGKIVIVDDFTGRTMAQRTWSAGLHQMVEAKEGVAITPPTETLARLSFQRFFRFYRSLAGMTGTAWESAPELWHVYGLAVVRIPQNRPSRRTLMPMRFFDSQEAKFAAIVADIEAMHAEGRPVLAGTRSVRTSETLASLLTGRGLNCRIINAVRHQEEAAIIAEAGKRGAITVATNMAGRGTDILVDREVEALGGLHVIAAECNESLRIDRQLFGRSARQGDRGSAQAFVSLDDELFLRYLSRAANVALRELARLRRLPLAFLGARALRRAQGVAQQRAYRSRQAVQKFDTWVQDSLTFGAGEF
jgi:preprotein translocase subunit SecA